MLVFFLACTQTNNTHTVKPEGKTNTDEPAAEPSQPATEPTSEPSEPATEPSQPATEPAGEPSSEENWQEELFVDETSSHLLTQLNFLDVPNASVWNFTAPANEGFYFTTHDQSGITLRILAEDLSELRPAVELTEIGDISAGETLADHALLRVNDRLFVAYSLAGDADLFLFSTDLDGIRENWTAVQVDGAPDLRTNDPQLFHQVYDGEDWICLRWGRSGPEKQTQCYDELLNPLYETPLIVTSEPTSQLGMMLQNEDEMWYFAGDAPQRSLIYARYDLDWTPLSPFETVILATENNEWNWASTGVTPIPELNMWAIAYTHMPENGSDMDARARLALFDSEFNMLNLHKISGQGTFRPHLLYVGNSLIVSYDAGPVMVEQWEITPQ
ncbi:MAG: hypothetical protein CMK59_09950 [Proteobacteria bacterium]|nr:hypothetical protein [Pseudomonadota bacterium]